MSQGWPPQTIRQILASRRFGPGPCLVLGKSDTGKTSLVDRLIEKMPKNARIALVDADMGQSRIGPPTTIGYALIDKPKPDFRNLKPAEHVFVGNTTCVTNMLESLAGIVRVTKKAQKQAEFVIIDTPGYVDGPAGAALWQGVFDLLSPTMILAIAAGSELQHIVSPMSRSNCTIKMLSPHGAIRPKSTELRRNYRQQKFTQYFQNNRIYRLDITNIPIQRLGYVDMAEPAGRIVGLRDNKGDDMAIGYITKYQPRKNILTVSCPPIAARKIRSIALGQASFCP